MANYLGGGGFDPESYMMRKIMDDLFGGSAEKEASAQRKQNRYERLYAQKVGNMEGNYDVKQLDDAYNRGVKFRDDIVAGVYKIPDQEIFLETIDAHQENLDRYRSSVQDYDAKATTYRNTSNQIADLSRQLNVLDKSTEEADFAKARNTAKQITGLIGDQTQLFSNMTTKYSSRFKNDTPLQDYMSNIRVSNKYLIDFMGDNYLSDWEKGLYQRANSSGDYSIIQKGVSRMDSLKQSFMGDEQKKVQTLHQELKSIYSVLSTGETAEGVKLDAIERQKLASRFNTAKTSLDSSIKLYEENTGDALLGEYLGDPKMSPWITTDTIPSPPKTPDIPSGELFPEIKLDAKITELPVSALSNYSSWELASSRAREGGLSEFFGRDDIVDKPTEGGGKRSVLEFDASNVLSAYENRANRGNIRKQLTVDSPIIRDLARESGVKAKHIVDIVEPRRKELAKKKYVVDLFEEKKPAERKIKRSNDAIKKLARESKIKGDYRGFADEVIRQWEALSKDEKSKYGSFEDWINRELKGKKVKQEISVIR